MSAIAATMIIVGLAMLIFIFFVLMKNRKSNSSGNNIVERAVNNLTQGAERINPEGITPATPTPKPKLTSRFTNTPRSLGGPPKDSGINFADDFNFKDPNEGKSLFCRVTKLC